MCKFWLIIICAAHMLLEACTERLYASCPCQCPPATTAEQKVFLGSGHTDVETLVYCLELSKASGRFYIHFWEVLNANKQETTQLQAAGAQSFCSIGHKQLWTPSSHICM